MRTPRVLGRPFQLGSKNYLKLWSSLVPDVSISWHSGDLDTIYIDLLPRENLSHREMREVTFEQLALLRRCIVRVQN